MTEDADPPAALPPDELSQRYASLLAESSRREQWLAASAEISAQLVTADKPLQLIAYRAYDIGDVDLVVIGLLEPDGRQVRVAAAVGEGAEAMTGRIYPLDHVVSAPTIRTGESFLLERVPDTAAQRLPLGPGMFVPIVDSDGRRGNLSILRRPGGTPFTEAELSMAKAFAHHASIALELSAAHATERRIALLEDRDRIARDLHDHVIQQLFAVGLSLEGIAATARDDPEQAGRIRDQIGNIDRTIRQIRTTIFDLRNHVRSDRAETRQLVLQIAHEVTPALGFAPAVTFSGPVDLLVSGELGADIAAVVREGLTNVVKHANATVARIDLSVATGQCVLTISDNGRGMPDRVRESGLANLGRRAEKRAGAFTVSSVADGGTTLTWKVPVDE